MAKRQQSSRDQKRKAKLKKRERRNQQRGPEFESISEMVDAWTNGGQMWRHSTIDRMTNQAILGKLYELGIEFSAPEFRAAASGFYRGYGLAQHLWGPQMDRIEGCDGDFPWMAADVLWSRLCPERPNGKKILDEIDRGTVLLRESPEECCRCWLQVWETLKVGLLEGTKDSQVVSERVGHIFCLDNWLCHFESHLAGVGEAQPELLQSRLELAQEALQLLPESDDDFLRHRLGAIAQSHFLLGDPTAGDAAYRQLFEKYPHYHWGYVYWGDAWCNVDNLRITPNPTKARELYIKARDMATDEDHVESIENHMEVALSDYEEAIISD